MGFSSHVWRNRIVVIVCILSISQSAAQLYCWSAHPLDFWTWFCHVCRWLTLNSLNLTIYIDLLQNPTFFNVFMEVSDSLFCPFGHPPAWQITASQAKEARNKALLNGDVQVTWWPWVSSGSDEKPTWGWVNTSKSSCSITVFPHLPGEGC